jgi:hypothetical protein
VQGRLKDGDKSFLFGDSFDRPGHKQQSLFVLA